MEEIVREFGTREKESDPSRTAELIAMRRATESMRPEGERICYDPYAVRFINPAFLRAIHENPEAARAKAAEVARTFPGLAGSILARVRFFDDFVANAAATGIRQLVILGAGYDTRAYRTPGLEGNIQVFEVDHPLTQQPKKEKIREIFGSLPAHVAYVPADLGRDSLTDGLAKAGYDRTEKTLYILEGLVMYLPPAVVDGILSFIAENSGTGSIILFDYYPLSLVNGMDQREIARNLREFSARAGEPVRFGVPDNEISPFLEGRGFCNTRNICEAEYRALYFHGSNAGRATTDLITFAIAEVP
jgi:methyltransferase (TIGR00027 family)